MPAFRLLAIALITALAAGCSNAGSAGKTDADAVAFLSQANDTLLRLGNEASQAGWVQNTYITPDTEAMSARASEAYMTAATNFSKQATQYDEATLPDVERRQLTVLKNGLTMAAPADQKEAAELAQVHLDTLRRLESGERPPYMPTLTKIARGYGVSIEEVVEG